MSPYALSKTALQLLTLHGMAIALLVGCLMVAEPTGPRSLYWLPAAGLLVVGLGSLWDFGKQVYDDQQKT